MASGNSSGVKFWSLQVSTPLWKLLASSPIWRATGLPLVFPQQQRYDIRSVFFFDNSGIRGWRPVPLHAYSLIASRWIVSRLRPSCEVRRKVLVEVRPQDGGTMLFPNEVGGQDSGTPLYIANAKRDWKYCIGKTDKTFINMTYQHGFFSVRYLLRARQPSEPGQRATHFRSHQSIEIAPKWITKHF